MKLLVAFVLLCAACTTPRDAAVVEMNAARAWGEEVEKAIARADRATPGAGHHAHWEAYRRWRSAWLARALTPEDPTLAAEERAAREALRRMRP